MGFHLNLFFPQKTHMKTTILPMLVIFFLFLQIYSKALPYEEFLDNNIGITNPGVHGFLPVNSTPGNEAFYWYIENQKGNDSAPLFITIPNGVGKSVLVSYFVSFGSDTFLKDGHKLHKNPNSWNIECDLLLLDLPLGTGFSKYSDPSQIPTTIKQKVSQFEYAISKFFEKNHELKEREIYLVT